MVLNPDLTDDAIIGIVVSFDGNWRKWGFTSNYGVGASIEVNSGLVIDYKVVSRYGHACKLAESREPLFRLDMTISS
jgi:hypothetical protein